MPHYDSRYGQVISADELCDDCSLVKSCHLLKTMEVYEAWAEVKGCSFYKTIPTKGALKEALKVLWISSKVPLVEEVLKFQEWLEQPTAIDFEHTPNLQADKSKLTDNLSVDILIGKYKMIVCEPKDEFLDFLRTVISEVNTVYDKHTNNQGGHIFLWLIAKPK